MTAWVRQFDAAIDRRLEPWRRSRPASTVFYAASIAGEFSALWQVINVVLAIAGAHTWRWAGFFAACIAAESLLVNQGVKRLFRRRRPAPLESPAHRLRTPRTSSFPSGHASAATVAAVLLIAEHRAWWPAWVALSATVAISRPFVRVHYASDILGGVAVGLVLGALFLALPLP